MKKETLVAQLLSYLIVSDKQIHSNEIKLLEEFWQAHEFSKDEQSICLDILGDKNDASHFDELLSCIDKLNFEDEEKQQLIALLCELIVCDMHIDDSEHAVLEKIAKQLKFYDYKHILNAAHNQAMGLKRESESKYRPKPNTLGLKVRSFFSFGRTKKEINRKINRFLLQGPKYGEAIRSGAAVAAHDMEFIAEVIKENSKIANECLEVAKKTLKNNAKNNTSKESEELYKNINSFIDVLENKVLHAVRENKEILNRKKRAMNYFTISFLGKTKAGKSTLHAVMTGSGNAFIGSGSQRTTRFNRVYEWDNVRVIDTPGIGAAEEGGRTDEEIARSVIDETDVLCYLVTSDNIQKTEFDFMESIRAKNKPIIILLNVKKDFTRPKPIFDKFLQDPHYWAERNDEENIQGHINHINDYLGQLENFNTDLVKIIPVQLLAARLSNDENYQAHKEKLYEGSHIDYFLDYIRESIVDSVALRRSQTIIDGTAHYINENIKDIAKLHASYVEFVQKIKTKKSSLLKKLKNDQKKVTENCLQDMDALFGKFQEQLNVFAENHYDLKKEVLEKAWNTYAKGTMKIEERVEEVLRKNIEQEQKDIQDYLSDLAADIDSFFNYRNAELPTSGLFNTKRLFSGLGVALGAVGATVLLAAKTKLVLALFGAAAGPIGWVLVGAGVLVGVLSKLLKSKEKKRQEAIKNLSSNLQKSMEENREQLYKQIPQIIEGFIGEMSGKIEKILSQIQSGAETIEKNSNTLLHQYKRSFGKTNQYFAKRICDFCTGNIKSKLEPSDYAGILVERDYGKAIRIRANISFPRRKIENLQKILQESVHITKSN